MAELRALWLLQAVVLTCMICQNHIQGTPAFSISEYQKINYLLDTPYLGTRFSLPTNLTTVSYCLHFKMLFLQDESCNFFLINPLSLVMFGSQDLYFSEGYTLFSTVLEYKVPIREWVHLCISVYGDNKVYINGVEKRTSVITGSSSQMQKLQEYTLSFGSNYEVKSSIADQDFGARIADLVVLPRKISQEEVTALAQCQVPPADNVVAGLAWQEMRYLRDNNVILTRDVKLDPAIPLSPWALLNSSYSRPPSLPKPAVGVLDLNPCAALTTVLRYLGTGGFTYDEAASWCKKFAGVLPSANHTEIKSMKKALTALRSDVAFWVQGKSRNNTCSASIYYDLSNETRIEVDCDSKMKKMLVCQIPENASFTVLGEGMDSFDKFYLDRDGFQSMYRTRYRDSIALNSENTEYQITKAGKILFSADKQALDVPIGKFWRGAADGPGDEQETVISACAVEEFTCNDGSCMPLTQHCDGLQQCPDFEDEECSQNSYLAQNYDNTRASNTSLPIKLNIRIKSISDVDISNGRLKLKIEVKTSWKDGRIEFVQLQEELERNVISEDIWYPKYHFETLVFEDERDYYQGNNSISKLLAARGNATAIKTYKTQRKRLYEAEVVHMELTSFTLLCDFDLTIYPFGVHPCMYNITLDDQSDNDPYFNVSAMQLALKEQRMSLFMVRYSCFQVPSNSTPRTITVTLSLNNTCQLQAPVHLPN
ncbi:uncharacterized protein LOC125177831 [Hyalella azteca]|uniref:Uncharacterized protein LOC125177831 n=1 Tax=Hyalella azteca TaxID=294128 RepID=A0A979FJ02_HYAAZ|nr:uncharacterized protein LOC125177831 [Hyalella azteca]